MIEEILKKITQDYSLRGVIMGATNDHCIHKGEDNVDERNFLFSFTTNIIAQLADNNVIELFFGRELPESLENIDEEKVSDLSKDANLFEAVAKSIKTESSKIDDELPEVELHVLILTALTYLVDSKLIKINV
jgi:hypothetical protein